MKSVFKEPLFHFMLIGVFLFLLNSWEDKGAVDQNREQIVVSSAKIEQLAVIFHKTWQRPPTEAELISLIDDFVLEEVYYRQAVQMGIDRDDTIIRRRLRQKLEFLTDDVSALKTPSAADLYEYLSDHPELFRESAEYSFRQIYFNPDKHTDKPEGWYQQELDRTRKAETDVGDPTLIPSAYQNATSRQVAGSFGGEFVKQLNNLEIGKWQGPVRSGLGMHFVLLQKRTEGRLPDLEEIRHIVEREWRNTQRQKTRENMNQQLLDEYELIIEWPERTEQQSQKQASVDGVDS